ncbi:hypothetical protein C2U39_19285 [Aeromonas sp. ASNIH3]|nr:hypothetical protein C2U39_19285 [Aeromonas sp. ASNIH3]
MATEEAGVRAGWADDEAGDKGANAADGGAAATATAWVGAAAEVGSAPCKGKLHTPIMAMRVLGFIIGISCCLLLSAARAISLAATPNPENDKGEPGLPLRST